MRPGEGIYTFVDNSGVNINIASQRLHDWCAAAGLEPQLAPVDRDLSKTFIRDNAVSRDRVKELMKRKDLAPIILCKDGTFSTKNGGPNVYLVDGHHRYVLYSALKLPYIPAYCLEVEQWKPFEIEGLSDISREALRDIPILKRSY